MKLRTLIAPTCLSALVYMSGCSGVGTDVLAGRRALQSGQASDAVGYLKRAADLEPSYKTPYRVRVGVLSYLGRAYYESGKDADARQVLNKAVSLDKDDPLAHLYLGLTLIRNGDAERGRKEIQGGLKAIDDTLEYINMDRIYGFYWDPGMNIRGAVKMALAAKLDNNQLATEATAIGRSFDEEIDRARRDESRRGGGSDGGGGGGS